MVNSGGTLTHLINRHTMTYLDSPSAGTHTYKTQMSVLSSSNSGQVRAQYSTTDNGFSFLTLMEVAV